MPVPPRVLLAAPLVACIVLSAGCERAPASSATETDVAARIPAPDPAPVATPEAPPPAASPMNERDRDRAEAWSAAIAGLDASSGVLRVVTPPATPDPAARDAALERAEEQMAGNHSTGAVAAFADAVRAAPDDLDANLGLARALVIKGKLDLAEAAYRRALEIDDAHVDAQIELAETMARTDGRRPEAIDTMYRALQLSPRSGRAHERLAVWLYYEEAYDRSWEHVLSAQAADYPVPPQFLALLNERR